MYPPGFAVYITLELREPFMSLAKHIVDRLIFLGATAEVKGLEVVNRPGF